MKKIIFLVIINICFSNIQSQTTKFNRMFDYGVFGSSGNRFHQVIQKGNNYFAFGQYDTTGGYIQPTCAKLDSSGNLIFWKSFRDTLKSIVLSNFNSDVETDDRGYIVSGTSWELPDLYKSFLIKLDSNLNMQWRRYYYDTAFNTSWLYRDYGFQCLKITPDKGYIAVGIRYKSGGTSCGLAVKFDSLGNEQWVRTYNLNYYMSSFNTVDVMPDGYVFGGAVWITSDKNTNDNIITKIDTAGNVIWQKTLGGTKGGEWVTLQYLPDSNIMIQQTKCDSAFTNTSGDYISFPKLQFYKMSSATGDTTWSLSYGSAKFNNICYSFRVFPDGSALAAGIHNLHYTPWLLKINNEGIVDWYKEYSLLKPDYSNYFKGIFYDLQQTEDKGFVLCGEIRNADSTNGNCGWILKIDAQGNWQDSSTYIMPGVKLQSSISLFPNPASSRLTVGYFQEMEEAVLEIYNTLGIKQMEIKLPQGQSSYSFSISHLAKGYYKAILKEKGNIRGQQGLVISE